MWCSLLTEECQTDTAKLRVLCGAVCEQRSAKLTAAACFVWCSLWTEECQTDTAKLRVLCGAVCEQRSGCSCFVDEMKHAASCRVRALFYHSFNTQNEQQRHSAVGMPWSGRLDCENTGGAEWNVKTLLGQNELWKHSACRMNTENFVQNEHWKHWWCGMNIENTGGAEWTMKMVVVPNEQWNGLVVERLSPEKSAQLAVAKVLTLFSNTVGNTVAPFRVILAFGNYPLPVVTI